MEGPLKEVEQKDAKKNKDKLEKTIEMIGGVEWSG